MSEPSTKDLPVTIKFQVGETHIALSELLQLSEGMVIQGEPVNTYFPKVRAVLGERTIAEGELVKVDGEVAFRVTKII